MLIWGKIPSDNNKWHCENHDDIEEREEDSLFVPKKGKHEDDEGGLKKWQVCTRHSMVDTIRGEDGPLQYTVTSGAIIRGKTYYIWGYDTSVTCLISEADAKQPKLISIGEK